MQIMNIGDILGNKACLVRHNGDATEKYFEYPKGILPEQGDKVLVSTVGGQEMIIQVYKGVV